jgi:hypothetical protein
VVTTADVSDHVSKKLTGSLELRDFGVRQPRNRGLKEPDTPSATSDQDFSAFFSRVNQGEARIVAVGFAADQSFALETCNQPRHGWRLNLLGCSQLAQTDRPAEYDDGKRGQSRCGKSARVVFAAQLPEEM